MQIKNGDAEEGKENREKTPSYAVRQRELSRS